MKRLLSTIIIIAGIASAAAAQQATPLSLNDCMEYALKHSYTMKNANIDVAIQEAQLKQTLSAALPHVNGKMDFNYFNVPQSQFLDAGTFDPTKKGLGKIQAFAFSLDYAGDASITASQTIFDGSVFIAVKARNAVMELAKNSRDVTEENVRYNIYKAYNSLVIAYRQYDIIKSSLSYARSLEHDITVTQQSGFAEKIEVERTGVRVNNLATDSMRIGNLLTVSEQMLKYQIGMDINTPIVLTDTALEERRQTTLTLLDEQENYDRVPEYKVLQTSLTLNEFSEKRYKMTALPSINAFWSQGSNYGSNRFGDMFIFNRYYANSTIGLALTMPIFNGFLRKNQLREATLNVEKTKNNIEYMKQSLDFQTATSRATLKNAVLQVRSQKRNVELSSDVLDLAQKKYKAGVGSNVEVTQAQTDQLSAETNYFSALQDLINAEADLKKALGLLK